MVETLSRRHLLVSATGLGIAACTPEVRNTSPFWSTVTNNRPQKADADIRSYAEALPYPSMLFWFDGQARSLIVLGNDGADERRTWYTAEKQVVTTFGPFIVGAFGTEVELRKTIFDNGWSSDVRSHAGKSLSRETVVALRGEEATATLKARFSDAGRTTI